MPDLICGKAAVGGNYNSTRDSVTIDGVYVGVQASAQIIKERVHKAISDIPIGIQPLYDEIFR